MPSVTPPRFRIERVRIWFCFLVKIAVTVHFGVEQAANRLAVKLVGKTAKRLVKRVRVPMPRLFEQPLMRTIQFVRHWRLVAFGLKLLRQIFRDPISIGRTIDLTIAWCKVNATNKNKRVLFDGHDQERIKTLSVECSGKESFAIQRTWFSYAAVVTDRRFCTSGPSALILTGFVEAFDY
jgi:hypothetical protein